MFEGIELNKVIKSLFNQKSSKSKKQLENGDIFITFENIKNFFNRRLEAVSEKEFNSFCKDQKALMVMDKDKLKRGLNFKMFEEMIIQRNLIQSNILHTKKHKRKPLDIYYMRSDSENSDKWNKIK